MTDAQLDEQIKRKAEELANKIWLHCVQYPGKECTFNQHEVVASIANHLRETAADAYERGKAYRVPDESKNFQEITSMEESVPEPKHMKSAEDWWIELPEDTFNEEEKCIEVIRAIQADAISSVKP